MAEAARHLDGPAHRMLSDRHRKSWGDLYATDIDTLVDRKVLVERPAGDWAGVVEYKSHVVGEIDLETFQFDALARAIVASLPVFVAQFTHYRAAAFPDHIPDLPWVFRIFPLNEIASSALADAPRLMTERRWIQFQYALARGIPHDVLVGQPLFQRAIPNRFPRRCFLCRGPVPKGAGWWGTCTRDGEPAVSCRPCADTHSVDVRTVDELLPNTNAHWDLLEDRPLPSTYTWPTVQLVDPHLARPEPRVFVHAGRRVAELCDEVTTQIRPARRVVVPLPLKSAEPVRETPQEQAARLHQRSRNKNQPASLSGSIGSEPSPPDAAVVTGTPVDTCLDLEIWHDLRL